MSVIGRGVLAAATSILMLVVVPATAGAVLSGTNGRIVLASGRGDANDNNAKLYLRLTTGSLGGAPLPVTAPPLDTTAGQHRHPTWSPDRTMVAYARGDASCNPTKCDIYVLDLTTPGAAPVNITNTPNVNEDRPAWSPDGTRIAFESEVSNGSGQLDILVDSDPFGSGTNLNLTNTGTAGQFEGKPAWSPDSQTLYFAGGNPAVAPGVTVNTTTNIYKEPADNTGTPTLAVVFTSGAHSFQPSVSPDGDRMCFTLMPAAFGSPTATIMVADLTDPPSAGNVLGNDPAGNYNCTWSPDGTQVAYVEGTFGGGDLVMRNLNNPLLVVTLEESTRFDGNPDWAPDARPQCQDTTVTTTVNTPVEIPLPCEDTGPEYERTTVSAKNKTEPANGTVSPADAQELPASITYTPNPGFRGTDSFLVNSFDDAGFGDRDGTVTVNVKAPSNDFTLGKVKRNKKRGTAKLSVKVPGPGDVDLKGSKKIKPRDSRAERAGKLRLKVKPTPKTKAMLIANGKAKVKAKVTYTPDNGDPKTKSKRFKLKLN